MQKLKKKYIETRLETSTNNIGVRGGRAYGRPGGAPGRAGVPASRLMWFLGGRACGGADKEGGGERNSGFAVVVALPLLLSSRRLSWRGGHESLDLGEIYKKSHGTMGGLRGSVRFGRPNRPEPRLQSLQVGVESAAKRPDFCRSRRCGRSGLNLTGGI